MFARWFAAVAFAALPLVPTAAGAEVVVRIDKSTQRMTVSVDGTPTYVWPVSTGRAPFGTPNGNFRPQWMARRYFSRKYYNSPMPYSIFYHKGYAIHGTNYIRRLGGPASHGCVRLHPSNAATLFALVSRHGMRNTRIVVTGGQPAAVASRKRARTANASARPAEVRYRSPAPVYDEPPRRVLPFGFYR